MQCWKICKKSRTFGKVINEKCRCSLFDSRCRRLRLYECYTVNGGYSELLYYYYYSHHHHYYYLNPRVYNARGLKTEKIKIAEMTRGPEALLPGQQNMAVDQLK